MQIGFDFGATKIKSVILDEQGDEKHCERTDCPKDHNSIIQVIKEINRNLVEDGLGDTDHSSLYNMIEKLKKNRL
tara:strand:+ start:177 stop:401 length:225 start_codon:yes stop_codon:yes gene_type:complete